MATDPPIMEVDETQFVGAAESNIKNAINNDDISEETPNVDGELMYLRYYTGHRGRFGHEFLGK